MREAGATLIVGLILLSLVTLLGLAGASAARIEARLAQNERFRENATSAASAGIEFAIRRIVNTSDPAAVLPALNNAMDAASTDRFEATIRFAGFESSLPQATGASSVGAHFEIVSTGYSARRSVDRQRASLMLVVASANATPLPCDPPRVRCFRAGDVVRTGWQRVAVE